MAGTLEGNGLQLGMIKSAPAHLCQNLEINEQKSIKFFSCLLRWIDLVDQV